ncbi:SWI/SNF complex subunit SWI3D-like [Phragmites australis]|uniref:SWI/SNF complex subunit SWI3D-like n=1 Tax=Phragmites australis TaxID=29695 RepID=UPI002D793F06|nr:SWI/SNF complex subunit SWI3D-like [Phragmites australis]
MDMEPKPSPPDATPPKRKAKKEASALASASPPPKRQARDRNPVVDLPPPLSRPPTRKSRRKPAREKAPRRSVKPPPPPDCAAAAPARPSGEQEIEAVLSRGAGVHVVPTFAGWFSWKEIHPIEKQTLATFFDGKSERRTPNIYLGIRNFIMNKFHFNPQMHLESNDLSELSIGEMDARVEVLEFLAHWGLVNFHPFPPVGQECKLVESKSNVDTEEKTSLVEKLFQFETVQSYLVPVPNKVDAVSPAQVASLLFEPTLVEDAITAAESSVEYHCNSCSIDCSRKRYHCRTQADFDLCSDCYNEGKFDEGMSQADFILMESAKVPGSGGTSWTDQETLLLLEALEIFKANKWDDIAEHVATKTKAQCMLYFLQMPILDCFLDGGDFNLTSEKITEQASAEKGTFDVPEKMVVEDNAGGKENTDEKTSKTTNADSTETGTKLSDKNVSAKKDTKNSDANDLVASCIVDNSNKSSGSDPGNGEHASNFVIDVLGSAFEAVGHFLEKEDMGSFAEAGNPVMALAAFLAGLVEHDDAVTSCCSSLRAISEISPALLLATRHCFILPDPPSDLKNLTFSVSPASTGGEHQKDNDATPNANGTDKDSNKKEDSALTLRKLNASFTSQKEHQELSNTKGSCVEIPQVEANTNSTKDFDNPTDMVENSSASDKMRDECDSISHSVTSNNTNEPSSIASQEASAASTEDTTGPERVEGDKLSSEELPADVSPSQGKVETKKIEHAASSSVQHHESNQTETSNTEEPNSNKNIAADGGSIIRLQRAAGTAISAAAVKAKLLVEQEEDHIRRLAALVIKKQFQKVEAKMSFFAELEHLVLRARELTKKIRKKLLMERIAIIAARMAAVSSRPNQHGAPGARLPVGYAVSQQLRRP